MVSEKVMRGLLLVFLFGVCGVVKATQIANFEDLVLGAESYWNGSDGSGGFYSGNAWFNNNYNTQYGSWGGLSYSNITDTTTTGIDGQYNAIAGSGQGGSVNYAVGYVGWLEPPTMTLDEASIVDGLYVTNNNYTYYSMLYGDAYAKQFGGAGGDDEDWFLLTITGKDELDEITGLVEFYLADYRFANNDFDYIVDGWEYVDLTGLGIVKSVEFGLSSSDTGEWGMNTPAYFVIDTVIPEPATVLLLGLGAMVMRRRKL
jgi:hypothetical protein